jgi:hypothetical protein
MRFYIEHSDPDHEDPLYVDGDWISYARDATPFDGHVAVHRGSLNLPTLDVWGIRYIQMFSYCPACDQPVNAGYKDHNHPVY